MTITVYKIGLVLVVDFEGALREFTPVVYNGFTVAYGDPGLSSAIVTFGRFASTSYKNLIYTKHFTNRKVMDSYAIRLVDAICHMAQVHGLDKVKAIGPKSIDTKAVKIEVGV